MFAKSPVTFFLVSTPFWTGDLWTTLSAHLSAGSGGQHLLKSAIVWLCPGACLSIAFPAHRFELLPTLYRTWLGSLTPYPTHPAIFIAGYVGVGGVFALGGWALGGSAAAIEDVQAASVTS